jgi:hypothetical protein
MGFRIGQAGFEIGPTRLACFWPNLGVCPDGLATPYCVLIKACNTIEITPDGEKLTRHKDNNISWPKKRPIPADFRSFGVIHLLLY